MREVTIKNVLYRGANLFIYFIYYLGLTVVTLQSVKLLTPYAITHTICLGKIPVLTLSPISYLYTTFSRYIDSLVL